MVIMPITFQNSSQNIRRDDDLLCGRLVAMPTTTTAANLMNAGLDRGFRNAISVDFPAMPETIELARSADYAVNWNMVLPDGVHQYRGTKPLEIPVSFKLHFDDPYCRKLKGALTLLQLAARLQSFILPISTFQRGATVIPRVQPTSTDAGKGKPTDPQLSSDSGQQQIFEVSKVSSSKGGSIYPPITAWLHLVWTANDLPGISCIGYVREVKTILCGPWMRGPNQSFNMPTSAEFSFVFVHRPGHGNNFNFTSSENPPTIAETPQAFADDVKSSLYNTRDLVWAANFQGFSRQ
jgi:hypothetical protein